MTVWQQSVFKQTRGVLCAGFTLVEMLVVIGIIGLLTAALTGGFTYLRRSAWQAQAQAQVGEVATAMNLYLQRHREWPEAWINRTELDETATWILQNEDLMDVTVRRYSNGKWILNESSPDRFGLLDPWGRIEVKKNTTSAADQTLLDHRIQYRLDLDYDGYVDSGEGSPKGVKVRASVLVWSRGPDGKDDFQTGSTYPRDDKLSWIYLKSPNEN